MPRLSFGVRVVLSFFVFDAARGLGTILAARGAHGGGLPLQTSYVAIVVGMDLLLALEIGLGMRQGRFWGVIYLLTLAVFGVRALVTDPGVWLDLDALGRLRRLGTIAVYLGLMLVLVGRRSTRSLLR